MVRKAIFITILLALSFGLGFIATDLPDLARSLFTDEEIPQEVVDIRKEFSGEISAINGNTITISEQSPVTTEQGSFLNSTEVVGILQADTQFSRLVPDASAPNGLGIIAATKEDLQVGTRISMNTIDTQGTLNIYSISILY
jgi:hypothetical protein